MTRSSGAGARVAGLSVLLLVGCGPSTEGDDGGASECASDTECDNGLFCDGAEVCTAGVCAPGSDPCAGRGCDESTGACAVGCTTDADGDGVRAIACGGTDCDDADAARFAGNTEICDDADRDEDCDPLTFGARDADGDGYPSSSCCNVDGDERLCGTDCDDSNAAIHPTEAETCDGLDNDCSGIADDGVTAQLWPDIDGDGYGDDSAVPQAGCPGLVPNTALRGGDCDDASADVSPEALDGPSVNCNGDDDDCDGTADAGCGCITGSTQSCGPMETEGECRGGTQTCVAGSWESTCAGAVYPRPEDCGPADLDCRGGPYNGFACVSGASEGCMECALGGTRTCSGCTWSACSRPSPMVFNGTDTRLSHQCGSACRLGTCWSVSLPTNTSCYMQYGPYLSVPAGTYRATFVVGCNATTSPGDGFFTLDAYDSTTGTVLWTGYASSRGSTVTVNTPPFSVVGAGCHAIELRVLARGPYAGQHFAMSTTLEFL
jgi:hypothetical protein